MKRQVKFGIGIGIIVVSMACLAWLGYGESKTYYHTISELQTLHGNELRHRMRVGGTVEPGSIHRMTGRVDFVLQGEGKSLPVSYVGTDLLPDTFVGNSQALVEGTMGQDGRFIAEHVQAKCASKYAPSVAPPTRAASNTAQTSGM
jgi:cytochrome c-type biogenesis protein CcmE